MVRSNTVRQHAVHLEQHGGKRRQGQPAHNRTHRDSGPENGAEPVGRQTHQQIDGREADGEGEQDHERRAQPDETSRHPFVTRPILPQRAPHEEPVEQQPDEVIGRKPSNEEWDIQVRCLPRQNRIGGDHLDVGPFIEMVHPNKDRNRQNQAHGHQRSQVFRDPAEGHAPTGIYGVLERDHKQTPEADGQHEHEQHEPVGHKPDRIQNPRRRNQHHTDRQHDAGLPAESIGHGRWDLCDVVRRRHGRSRSGALADRCNARR